MIYLSRIPFSKSILVIVILALAIITSRQIVYIQAVPHDDDITASQDDEIHHILESSLSVIELNKEIDRIQDQLKLLEINLVELEESLFEQELQIESKKQQAGQVLRAYYTGERDFIYLNVLKSDSLQTFLVVLEYVDMILSHDRHILTSYIDDYRSLEEQYQQFIDEQNKLTLLEKKLVDQRDRVLALEQQMADQLDGRSDADRIRLLMGQLASFWEEKGLDEVRSYFRALASAMNALPAWLQNQEGLLEMNGFKYTVTISDDQLNTFLREQDSKFNHLEFIFSEDIITASGKRDNIQIEISGQYSIEDEPTHRIKFTVNELYFNHFQLPDTTRQELEQQFDLSFYPSLILSFLRANTVKVTDGKLVIELTLKL